MLRPGTQDTIISRKVNMPTTKSHAELVSDVAPKIKAQSFFSARVAEAHILEKLREVTDGYSRGEFGLGEARNKLKDFLRGEGYDPHQAGLRNLASTARLNLILKQNSAMANAAGEWKRMHDPDAMKVFPYVRYHARNDSRTRSEHGNLDGNIYRKDDPFLKTHTPPWEFNCRCWLEEITAKEAGREPDNIQQPTPADKVTVDSRSGFSFDPEHVFEKFELESIKSPEVRGEIREEAEIQLGDQVHFMEGNTTAVVEQKQYKSFDTEKLSSAKTWDAAPAPQRISPEDARKRLEEGFDVTAGDGRAVKMDQAVLDHWTVENNKLESDVNSRLSCLEYAVETLKLPTERWDQETQSRYLKKFQKVTGGYEGCMVVVTNDGKCRTYFLPSVSKLDQSRKGISYEVIKKVESSTGHSTTQTTETIAVPSRSDDRDNKISPVSEKVKEENEKNTLNEYFRGNSTGERKAIEYALEKISKAPKETLVVFDQNGNIEFSEKGTKQHTGYHTEDISYEDKIVIHNHPKGTYPFFSQTDLDTFHTKKIKMATVVSKDYVVSIKRDDSYQHEPMKIDITNGSLRTTVIRTKINDARKLLKQAKNKEEYDKLRDEYIRLCLQFQSEMAAESGYRIIWMKLKN